MFRKLTEVGGYSLMVMLNLVLSLLSRRTAYWLADYGMVLPYFICRRSRHTVLANVEYILRLSGGDREGSEFRRRVRRTAKQIFVNFGKQIYDMMMMTRYNRQALEEAFDFEQIDKMTALLKQGKGIIGVTAHFSSWELCATMIAMQYGVMNGVFMRHPNPGVNNFYVRQRGVKNVRTILPGKDSFRQCLGVLRRNEILAMAGDIDYSNNGVEIEFLGRRFSVPKGPALLALRSGSPMICAAFLRAGPARIRLEVGGTIEMPKEGSVDERVKRMAREYLRYFERVILEDPSQWIMFYPLAELPPAEPPVDRSAKVGD